MKSGHQQDLAFKIRPEIFDHYVSGLENLAGEGEVCGSRLVGKIIRTTSFGLDTVWYVGNMIKIDPDLILQ